MRRARKCCRSRFHLKDLVLEIERMFEDQLTEAQFRP
jgi:hypothetical protein